LKKNKISKNWISRQKKDIYVRQSKAEGYRSRAVFKIKEINDKFKIIRDNISVIDLGAAPGSWSQFLTRKIKNGKIISIDINEFDKVENVIQIVGDFTNNDLKKEILEKINEKFDLVLSDMAVNTTGNKNLDAISTGELCLEAISFAEKNLKKNGKFVAKVFMGVSFEEIIKNAKKIFVDVRIFKPLSSRKNSKENFIICKNLR
jgi:23S rRNA (uridine2552-2'-O)-methyltransferase|tara:strand:+ start:6092 stop:6703 length:612 start_codon:yes stop_codon:yes gene_type:complete